MNDRAVAEADHPHVVTSGALVAIPTHRGECGDLLPVEQQHARPHRRTDRQALEVDVEGH